MLDFETIKRECEPGVSVLIYSLDEDLLFVGFSTDNIIVENSDGDLERYYESEIENWTIKKEPQKKKLFAYKVDCKIEWYEPNRYGGIIHNNTIEMERRPEFDLTFPEGE